MGRIWRFYHPDTGIQVITGFQLPVNSWQLYIITTENINIYNIRIVNTYVDKYSPEICQDLAFL